MNKFIPNSQIDRIFNEIKEIGIRDSNNDEMQDSDNIYSFKPGFVSLLKNKFSSIDKDIVLPKFDRFRPGSNFKDITRDEASAVEIYNEEIPCKNIVSDTRRVFECIVPSEFDNEEIPCKNIVSDTRRVFECIVPKEVDNKDISNDKGNYFFSNDVNNTNNKITDVNPILKPKEVFDEGSIVPDINNVYNSFSDPSPVFKSSKIVENASIVEVLTNETNYEPSNVSEVSHVSKLRELYQEGTSNVKFNYHIYDSTTSKSKVNGVRNIKRYNDEMSQLEEVPSNKFGIDKEITSVTFHNNSKDLQRRGIYVSEKSQIFKPGMSYNQTTRKEKEINVSNDTINPKETINNISNIKYEDPEINQIYKLRERENEKVCDEKEMNLINVPRNSKDTTTMKNMIKNNDTEIKQVSKSTAVLSESINVKSFPNHQKPTRPVSNEIKSFIFNARDFKITKDKDSELNDFNYQEFCEIKPDPSLKSILSDKCVEKHVKSIRNLRFANNDSLVTIHIYEPEFSSTEEYNASNLIDTSNESSFQSPSYKISNLKTDAFNKESSIICNVDENVMDFKSDMLF